MHSAHKSSIILIGTVIVPALILAIFSANAIRSQTRILANEQTQASLLIASDISRQFDKFLNEIEQRLDASVIPAIGTPTLSDQIQDILRSYPFISNLMIMSAQYDLIAPEAPWIGGVRMATEDIKLRTEWKEQYARIETQEINGALEDAIKDYERLLNNTTESRAKALVLNALARSYRKRNNLSQALLKYDQLYQHFPYEVSLEGLSLGAIAQMERAEILTSMDPNGNRRKTLEACAALLNDILTRKLKCTRNEVLYYWTAVHATLDEIQEPRRFADEDLARYRELDARLNRILAAQKLAAEFKESRPLGRISSDRYGYVELDTLTGLAARTIFDPSETRLVFQFDIPRLKVAIREHFQQTLHFTETYRYEIVTARQQVFLAVGGSLAPPSPLARDALSNRLLGWQVKVRVDAPAGLRHNAKARILIHAGGVGLMLVVIGISVYFLSATMRRERELSRMKTEFVSTVSHEMRTPLTSIRMIGEMLLLGKITDKAIAQEYQDILTGEIDRLTRLINRVLDFSRMDAGRQPYTFAQREISPIIVAAVRSFNAQATHQGYRVKTSLEPDLPPVSVDADAITEVLLNLLDNAMKYSPGHKEIRVNAQSVAGTIRIEVIDQGNGIEPDKLDKIFEKFYRGEDELTRQTQGTGVGLAIVKHIVDAHGGRIDVASQIGKGSTFAVIFNSVPPGKSVEG